MAQTRALLKYCKDRHIAMTVTVGAKWIPQTLEGKQVAREPFRFGPDGIAKAVRPSATGAPINGDFERINADGTPVGWRVQARSHEPDVGGFFLGSSSASARTPRGGASYM